MVQRWVNDYNITKKIYLGYRMSLPLEIKDVGSGTSAILMEMADADHKYNQYIKQVDNDLHSLKFGIGVGHNLAADRKDIHLEARSLIIRQITKREMLSLAIRKMFGCNLNIYMDKIFKKKEATSEQEN